MGNKYVILPVVGVSTKRAVLEELLLSTKTDNHTQRHPYHGGAMHMMQPQINTVFDAAMKCRLL